jgi:hypothetical protein
VTFHDSIGGAQRKRSAEISSGAEYHYCHVDWRKELTMGLQVGGFKSAKDIRIHAVKGVRGRVELDSLIVRTACQLSHCPSVVI